MTWCFGMRESTIAPKEGGARESDGPSALVRTGPTLLALAPELIQIIADHLDAPDVEQFRLTCKALGTLLRPHVFRVLRLKVTKNTLRRDVERLRVLASAASMTMLARTGDVCPAFCGTRTLHIGPLAPSHDPSYRGPDYKYVEGEWIAEPEDESTKEVASGEEALRAYLFDALVSLKAIHYVEWTPHYTESEYTQRTVINALQTLPDLHSVRLSIGHCKIPLPLDLFTSLRSISLLGARAEDSNHTATLNSLARLVGASRSLNAINVASNWRSHRSLIDSSAQSLSLHGLFAHRSPSAPPLSLRHLALRAALMRLDEVTLAHLRNLTALSLTGIQVPEETHRGIHGTDEALGLRQDQRDTTTQRRYGSSLDEVWSVLKAAKIWLKELTVDVVVPALLEYLKAYQGLRKLTVTPGGFEEGMRSDALAEEFYATALGRHASSLQDLEIYAVYEGKWCFGPHNLGVVSACRDLKTLKMSVISGQLNSQGDDEQVDCIKLLLDTAVFSLPRLGSIRIDVANLEELRGAYCGNPVMAHFAHTTRRVVESISAYSAPPSCRQLPASLSIGSPARQFIPRVANLLDPEDMNNGMGRRLRYVDVTPPSEKFLEYGFW